MSGESGLEDFSLTDLFRSEVETHAEVLSTALLALERAPADSSRVDEMMRAAHSIKGAARVVGVEPAVSVAHVMEDCFVAAQKGTIVLTPADVDVLLRGVDLLGKISEATRDPKVDLAAEFDSAVKALVVELESMLVPKPRPAPSEGTLATAGASGHAPPKAPAEEPAVPAASIAVPEFLDAGAAEEVRREFLAAVESGSDPVRLDLRATRDLDVQGLVLLAAIPRHVERRGHPRVELAGLSPEMEAVLDVTGLSRKYGVRPGPTPGGA